VLGSVAMTSGLVACGGAPSSSSSRTPSESPTAQPHSPVFSVHVMTTGRDAVDGTFAVRPVLAGGVSTCIVPTDLSGTVAGHHFELQINGAGAAVGQQKPLSPGEVLLVIDSDTWAVGSAANAPHATAETLLRNTDGGGELVFQDLYSQSDPSAQPQESGSVSW